jgi:hypothetical protein
VNITNSPQTITMTIATAQTYVSMIADEFSGVGTLDIAGAVNVQEDPATTSNAVTSGSVTTATAILFTDSAFLSQAGDLPMAPGSHQNRVAVPRSIPNIWFKRLRAR